MLRLINVGIPTSHNEQFLCSERGGNPRFSSAGDGFTILAGEPAHISKTPFVVSEATPAAAWTAWYLKAGHTVIVEDDANLPGDVVLHLPNATTHLPAFIRDGWIVWIHDNSQDAAALIRSEFALPCPCWPSRHREQHRSCGCHKFPDILL